MQQTVTVWMKSREMLQFFSHKSSRIVLIDHLYWLDQFRCYDIRIHENSYLTHYIFSSLLYTQKYYFYVLNEESIPYKEKWTNKKLQKRTFQIKKASNLDPCIRGNGQFDKKFRAATVIKLLFP